MKSIVNGFANAMNLYRQQANKAMTPEAGAGAPIYFTLN